jgi:hypothetical protein
VFWKNAFNLCYNWVTQSVSEIGRWGVGWLPRLLMASNQYSDLMTLSVYSMSVGFVQIQLMLFN